METYSLAELNDYIKRVVALNFQEPLWINCEIAQCKQARGNYYLELVQQNDNDEVIAQSSAAIWYNTFLFLKSKLGELLPSLLTEGVEVKLKVNVTYNERYGLKLIVDDIDPSFTFGQMDLNRQKIIERLTKENVLELNKEKKLPRVLSNIAIISSETAAGYIDFIKHLEANKYGYQWQITLYQAAMQGSNTEQEVVQALASILEAKTKYDCVIIIRGGGSRLDLAAFDSFNIGMAIAKFPLPVLTGIGHEIDQSIADFVAHEAFKTPTAVANFLIDHNADFEAMIQDVYQSILHITQIQLKNKKTDLQNLNIYLSTLPKERLKFANLEIETLDTTIQNLYKEILRTHKQKLSNYESILKVMDPQLTLKRGYVLIKDKNKKYISSVNQLEIAEDYNAEFYDGEIDFKLVRKNAK